MGYSPSGCKELDMTEQLHLEDVFVRWKMGQREVAKKALMGRWNSTGGGSKAGDRSSIPGSGRSPREEKGYSLPYSCLENPMEEELGRLQSMRSQRVGHE